MQLNPLASELTTAATDAALGLLAAACAIYLYRYRMREVWKVGVWTWVFGLLVAASFIGALLHGVVVGEQVMRVLWQAVYLLLGLVVALFVVAAIYDLLGEAAARRTVPVMLLVALAFFVATRLASGTFLVFIVYEAGAMVFALGVYMFLAVRQRLPGASIIASAIGLNIVAATVQATGTASFTLVWSFNHNGVFHLIQMLALVVLSVGLRTSLLGAMTNTWRQERLGRIHE